MMPLENSSKVDYGFKGLITTVPCVDRHVCNQIKPQ